MLAFLNLKILPIVHSAKMLGLHYTEVTNKNIVQNHLNIALLRKV